VRTVEDEGAILNDTPVPPQLVLAGTVDGCMGRARATSALHTVLGLAPLLCVLLGVFWFGAARASTYTPFRGLACPSVSQCTAIFGAFDSFGREVTFNPTAPGTPTPAAIADSGDLHAVACPSVSQCTAVEQGGREVTFNPTGPVNPTATTIDGSGGLWAVACPSLFQCTAVDGAGREVTFDPNAPGTPTPTTIDGSGSLVAVACPSVLQCTAVDGEDREVTFDPIAPGAPTAAMVDKPGFCGSHCSEGYLTGVACPSVSQCTAVDDAGREVTFDPRAPGTPTPTYVTVETVAFGGLEGVACPSASQCTAVQSAGREVTFDPNAPGSPTPTLIDADEWVRAVACPSSAQCTVFDDSGGEVTFDPHAPGVATRAVIYNTFVTTTTTTGSTTSSAVAEAAGSAPVKRGVAAIRLACGGSGTCNGAIQLLVRVTRRRAIYHHGRWRLLKRTRVVLIGRASFSIAEGASTVVRVHLSRQGRALVLKAGRRGLEVRVGGSDVRTRSLVLRRSMPAAKQRRARLPATRL
jgi:hypothetical protein